MGRGMPRPLSCSWPSELFLFTMTPVTAAAVSADTPAGLSHGRLSLSATLFTLSPPFPAAHPLPQLRWCKMAAEGREEIRRGGSSEDVRVLQLPPCLQHLPLWTAPRARRPERAGAAGAGGGRGRPRHRPPNFPHRAGSGQSRSNRAAATAKLGCPASPQPEGFVGIPEPS